MSIQNKYDLKLIGNLTIDEVFSISSWNNEGTSNEFNSFYKSIGAIGNMIKSLDQDLSIFVEGPIGNDNDGKLIKQFLKNNQIKNKLHYSNNPTSKAIILSNLQSNERTSFVNWGCGKDYIKYSNTKSIWTHISYLDIISQIDLQKIKNNTEILSADLCLSDPNLERLKLTIEQIPYLDYLFISETEFKSFYGLSEFPLKNIILHTRRDTQIINKSSIQIISNNVPILEEVNVLGAGDAYCANFISYLIKNNLNYIKAAAYAHDQATNFITYKRYEKI